MQSEPKRMTAFDIFNRVYDPYTRYPKELRKHYIDIRTAVYRELNESGSCTLIDYFLAQYGPGSQFPFLPMLAALDAMHAVAGNKMLSDVALNYVECDHTRLPWSNLPDMLIVPTGDVKNLYRDIQRRYQETHPVQNPRNVPDGHNYSAGVVNPEPSGENLRNKAEDEANRIRSNAEKEAEKIRAESMSYANNIRREADEYAENIRNKADKTRIDAQNEANQTRIDAKNEADEILEDAQHSREDILREAREQADRDAEAAVERLIGEKLQTYIQEQRVLWEEERQADLANAADSCRAVAALKESACNQNTALGADVNRSLEQLQQQLNQQLNQFRAGMLSELQQWRTSLYEYEYKPLVNVCLQLAAKAESFERDSLKAQAMDITQEDARNMLAEHSISMSKLHNRMIRAMDKLGLRLFTPQPGELFNSEMHSVNDEEDDDIYLGRIIEACEKPGVERFANGTVSEILHRATVTLRPEQDDESC